MIRTATVVEVSTGGATVRNSEFRSAKAASSRRFWGVRERGYAAAVAPGVIPHPGDVVEIFVPPGPTVAWGAITLIFPLLLFPVGWWIAGKLFPSSGEGIHFLIGVGTLALTYPVIGFLSRRLQRSGRGKVPEIQRVLSREEAVRLKCEAQTRDCGGCAACG